MKIKKFSQFAFLFLLPCLSMAAIQTQTYVLTDNSYYTYSYTDFGSEIGEVVITDRSTLTGFLQVNIDDSGLVGSDSYSIAVDYSNVFLNASSFRPIDTLTTDSAGFNSGQLISGWTGEFEYIPYGNAELSPFPFICVECGYEMQLNLGANPFFGDPLLLSYHESNNYASGQVDFELFVSQVPLPGTAWLLGSGLLGLAGLKRRR